MNDSEGLFVVIVASLLTFGATVMNASSFLLPTWQERLSCYSLKLKYVS